MQNITVAKLADLFLIWVKRNRKPLTHRNYADLIRHIVKHFPRGIQVRHLKRFHLTEILNQHPDWGQNQRHNFLAAANRMLVWACEEGFIDSSPIPHLRKPGRVARDSYWTQEDFDFVVANITSEPFRRLVKFAWETGIRPQEARLMQVGDYNPDSHIVILPPERAKGGKSYRVIYLTPEAENTIRIGDRPSHDPLFANENGKIWTRHALNGHFHRIKIRTGRSFHFGAIRKGFCTQAIKNGVDLVTLANLMGHADTTMIAKVYSKVHKDHSHMILNAIKAKNNISPVD